MRLARVLNDGKISWGLVDRDATSVRLIAGGPADWAAALMQDFDEATLPFTGETVPFSSDSLLPPMDRTNKVIVVGANYRKHVKEFGLDADTPPIAFMKPYNALISAHDSVRYPPLTTMLDYEVELVAVTGTTPVPGSDPMKSILGYTVGNDISARDLQKGSPGIGMDLLSAKGLDQTCPLGPWIVTRDEFGDTPPDLRMTLTVNGETRQDGRSSEMTWDVGKLADYVNQRTTLDPGDIMFTGTPDGVAKSDGRFINVGDRIVATIEGIGQLDNVICTAKLD